MVLNGHTDTIEKPPVEEGDIGTSNSGRRSSTFSSSTCSTTSRPGPVSRPVNGRRQAASSSARSGVRPVMSRIIISGGTAVWPTSRRPSIPRSGNLNRLFATAGCCSPIRSRSARPMSRRFRHYQPFLVENIFTDFKRHDLGPNFHERNYDGTIRTHFMTTPLWGVGSTPRLRPRRTQYQPDGGHPPPWRRGAGARASICGARSPTAATRVVRVPGARSILFPPDDTASNLDPGDRAAPGSRSSGTAAFG